MSSNNLLKWPGGALDFTNRPLVMGILNVTPDSFSDGGEFIDPASAVEHGLRMATEGAALIDIGPESSRPGSLPVDTKEQILRAVPIIEKLVSQLKIPISIDTPNPEVARAAIDAGASIINDITACTDERMIELAAQKQVPIILMHMLGSPQTMQQNPEYGNVVEEVLSFLLGRAKKCEDAGIAKEMIIIDPGIGFGKNFEHNIELLKNLDKFTQTGYRVLLGASRKRFIGQLTGRENPSERLYGTLATTALAAINGVDIVRVHDVAENVDFIKTFNTIF